MKLLYIKETCKCSLTEIFEMINNIAAPIMPSLFEIRENIHNNTHFVVRSNENLNLAIISLDVLIKNGSFVRFKS